MQGGCLTEVEALYSGPPPFSLTGRELALLGHGPPQQASKSKKGNGGWGGYIDRRALFVRILGDWFYPQGQVVRQAMFSSSVSRAASPVNRLGQMKVTLPLSFCRRLGTEFAHVASLGVCTVRDCLVRQFHNFFQLQSRFGNTGNV